MITLDEQVDGLRRDLDGQCSRVRSLERDLDALRARQPGKDFWDKLEALSGILAAILTGLAVFGAGYYLNDSVKLAFEERRLQLENVKEMQTILLKLPTANTDEARASALALASFGEPAIGPLVLLMDEGQQAPAASTGLRAVGVTYPASVCENLVRVISNRTRLYRSGTHQLAIRLIGELRCVAAGDALAAYATLTQTISRVEDLPRYLAVVRDEPTLGNLRDLTADLARARASVR